MQYFNYSKLIKDLYTPDIINLVSAIHEFKGKNQLFVESKAIILKSMHKVAMIQSTEASNRIEDIFINERYQRYL